MAMTLCFWMGLFAWSCCAIRCSRRLLWFGDFDSVHLLAWRLEEGRNTTVLLEPTFPWEADVHAEGSVLFDALTGEYRAYYISQPQGAANQILGRMLTVATSKDGIKWTRPMLPIVQWGNFSRTNILLKNDGGAEISQVSVFLNNSSPYRYEMFFLSKDVPPAFRRFPPSVTAACAAVKPISTSYSGVECTYRMQSVDGFTWLPLEVVGNINAGSSGSFVYRGEGGSYSAFIQLGLPAPPGAFVPWDIGAGHQRMIVRSTSNSGAGSGGVGTWSQPTFVAQPDWRDGQGDQLVGLYGSDTDGDSGRVDSGSGSSRFAACSFGGQRVQVGVVGIFHAISQTIDNQFALSADGGKSWWRPARRPNVPLRPLGEWGSGLIWPFRSLVTDAEQNATLHMYFSGTEGLHGDLFSTLPAEVLAKGQAAAGAAGAGGGAFSYGPARSYAGLTGGEGSANYEPMSLSRTSVWFSGAFMRSSWSKGRLYALVPASGGDKPGVAVTKPVEVEVTAGVLAVQLHLNAATVRGGSVTAELIDWSNSSALVLRDPATAPPLPGFSQAKCTPFRGDNEDGVITWGRGSALPADVTAVRLRLVVLRARVYGMNLEF